MFRSLKYDKSRRGRGNVGRLGQGCHKAEGCGRIGSKIAPIVRQLDVGELNRVRFRGSPTELIGAR